MKNELLVGARVSVYWPNDRTWFPGTLSSYSPQKGFVITYDDGDIEEVFELDDNIQIDSYPPAYLEEEEKEKKRLEELEKEKNNLNSNSVLSNKDSIFQSVEDEFSREDIIRKDSSKKYIKSQLQSTVEDDDDIFNIKESTFREKFGEEEEVHHFQHQDEGREDLEARDVEEEDIDIYNYHRNNNDNIDNNETLNDSLIIIPNKSFNEPKNNNFSQSFSMNFSSNNNLINEEKENENINWNNQMNQSSSSYLKIEEINRELLNSQLPLLSKRSILLVGTILKININKNNFIQFKKKNFLIDNKNNSNDFFEDDKFFFKLSFIEGGPQPILFRCKTPIFTSSLTQISSLSNSINDFFLTWDASSFRFDIVLPKGSSTSSSKITGDLLLALYCTNSVNSSNVLVGQINIDLSALAQNGTIEHSLNSKFECRSLNGLVELSSPASSAASSAANLKGNSSSSSSIGLIAESEVQLFMCWKESDFASTPSSSTNSLPRNNLSKSSIGGVKPTNQVKKIPTKPSLEKEDDSSVKKDKKVALTPGTTSGAGGTRSTSAGKQRVATLSSSGFGGVATRTNSGKVLLPPPRKISSAIVRKRMEDSRRIEKENKALQTAIQKKSSGLQRGSAYGEIPSSSSTKKVIREEDSEIKYDRRKEDQNNSLKLKQVEDLKKNIASELDLMKTIKSKINFYESQIRKYDIVNEKKNMMTSSSSASNSRAASPASRSGAASPASSYASSKGTSSNYVEYLPGFDEENEKKKNAEYNALRTEYDILQGYRRSLIFRKKNALKLLKKNKDNYFDGKKQLFLSRYRVENVLEEEVGPLLTSYSLNDPFFDGKIFYYFFYYFS